MGKLRRALALVSLSLAHVLALAPAPLAQGEPAAGPRVPLLFTPNRGQHPPEVRFQARAPGLVASVLADGLHLDLDGASLRLRFAGASERTRAEGLEPRAARAHFLTGGSATRDLPTFARVRLCGLRPGVDLELHEHDGRLEYDLLVAPGADAGALELVLEGADEAAIDGDGALCASLVGRSLRQLAPLAWQEDPDGRRTPLACAWRELGGGGRFGFALEPRAPDAALVIDPVLVYGAYVGGSNADQATGAFVDDEGALYVAGWARSVDFPVTDGSSGGVSRGKEAVVFKLAPGGRELVYATTFGGRGDDEGVALCVGADGQAIVAGTTESDDFPTTENAFDRRASGGADGFVLGLAADGSRLSFSTLLGGSAEDAIAGLALQAGGAITVAGTTRSRDFPLGSRGEAREPRGGRDVFVTRLDSTGERLLFSTRLGGSDDDECRALALDPEGACYLTGRTGSHDFPTTLGALDRERCGVDSFVLKLSAGGRTLLYSTFLGGSGPDEGTGIAVDAEHRAVVVGWTQSLDFPFDPARPPAGRKDGFAVRLSAMGNALLHAAPLGGGSADEALGVALDPLGDAWVVGRTRSHDLSVSRDAHQARLGGAADAFLVRLSAADGESLYATYLGGEGEDELCGVHADRSGTSLVLCGSAANVPQAERGPLSGRRRGPSDAFLVRIDPRAIAPVTPGSLKAGFGLGF